MSRNSVLLLPFLAEVFFTDVETVAEALMKTFTEKIHNHGEENTP